MNAIAGIGGATRRTLIALGLVLSWTAFVHAQDPGEKVVLTLKSGGTYSGELVSRSSKEVTLRIGDSDIVLPASMVATIEAAPKPGKEEPAVAPSPSGAAASPPAVKEAEPTGEPSPAAIILKDGTVIEGFVVKKQDGRLWIVPGRAREVKEDAVDEIIGNTSLAGDGLSISGDAAKDSFRLIKELESGELARIQTATALLRTYVDHAGPALLRGIRSEDPTCRKVCLTILAGEGDMEALAPTLEILRKDPEKDVRALAAGALTAWKDPLVRRTLLEVAWRDRDDSVKAAAVRTLNTMVTVEEVSGLIDLLNILPLESKARVDLSAALRRATGERFSDDRTLWLNWWEAGGGRDTIGDKVQALILKRMEEESRPR